MSGKERGRGGAISREERKEERAERDDRKEGHERARRRFTAVPFRRSKQCRELSVRSYGNTCRTICCRADENPVREGNEIFEQGPPPSDGSSDLCVLSLFREISLKTPETVQGILPG